MTYSRLGSSVPAKRAALCVALSLCFAGTVNAQSTTGSLYGNVPAGESTSVLVTNNSGFSRSVSADPSGRYNFSTLPVGEYTVTLQRNGQVAGTRTVTVRAGAGVDVSFGAAGGPTTLEAVTVTGATIPSIDITATDTRSVITAEQLERLPLQRSAEAIALLAPGAIKGAGGYFGDLVSFGGSGVSENAYYLNGYFSGEPLSNLGGISLPFGAIDQQETYIGGYSAKYGRSAGGVISQIGKRGTNDWEFGGQVVFAPKSLRADRDDLYFPALDFTAANANPNLPSTCGVTEDERCQWAYEDADLPGTLYSRGRDASSENLVYSAYVGGPIVQDRLFFFVGGEYASTDTTYSPTAIGSPRREHREQDSPKIYGKLDWNINDDHFLEFTYMREKIDRDGLYYDYDFETGTEGDLLSIVPTPLEQNSEYQILKYTGYLTDSLTFSAVYGQSEFTNRQINPGILEGVPYVVGFTNQDPAIVGSSPIPNRQAGYQGRDGLSETEALRADLEWVVGDHTLTLGVDNIKFEATNEGTSQVAEYWQYARASNPSSPISASLGVGAPGGDGYYVRELAYFTNTSMSLDQKAWYLEDRWQVTDNVMLSLGIRNDQFTNKNDLGEAYMDAKNQWAPRLGLSWDVFGDASFKLFANAGRYFLAMPNNVAIRGASASTFTYDYYTYTGVDQNGLPTGLTPVPGVGGAPPPGPVSSNGEYGTPVDVLAFAPSDLKNMYQDEYILGFETMVTESLMLGTKFTYRDLKSSIDDICDPYTLLDRIGAVDSTASGSGYIAELADGSNVFVNYCYMFNPGGTNTFSLANLDAAGNPTGQRTDVVMSSTDWRFEDGLKRTYSALDLYLERPFDGKWEARVDYTFSFSRGNNEGQVKSEFGQTNISKTQDWDVAEMMRYASGYLANDRRHQLKVRGSYAITPELLVSGNLRVESGMPISCLGLYNPDGSIDENTGDADPVGYGSSYHTCFGEIARPGSQRTPWINSVDLGINYVPEYLNGRLSLGLQVFNVFNETETLQVDVTSGTDAPYTVSNSYLLPNSRQTPRYVMFSAAWRY
jgi:outer membrane receptor for ferrienterochelin and colicin